MVFESVVTDVLNRILGDYVENLDSKQLQIGIWGGDVVLQNLKLKQNALEDLDLPVQTVYGRLGKLVLKIPWKNLYGAPVEAIIDNLYLLVVPNQEVKYDPEKEERIAQENKQTELQRIDEAKKKEEDKGKKKLDDSFIEKLTTQIIKNVQIKISNIHIRYEDKVTHPTNPFSCGITLSNLSVETTDDTWTPAIITDALSKIFKVLSLEGLAVYWNCNSRLYSNLPTDNIMTNFVKGIATRDVTPKDYLYILGPINSSARLRMNPKPEKDEPEFSMPKILLNLELEKLAIGISKCQYQDIMLMAESMDRMIKGLPYRKYRPNVGYKNNTVVWWKFAYTCILEETVKRRRRNWDWNHIKEHRNMCREYAKTYQEKLLAKKVPEDLKKKIENFEKKLNLFNLIIIRQQIELEVERLAKKTEELSKQKKSWFSGWWGQAATDKDKDHKTTADIMRRFEEAMTADEKAKLFRAIDYQENSAPAEYPEEYVATSCAFLLKSLEIVIRDDSLPDPRILSSKLKGVNCRLQQRPAANAINVGVKIDQLTVYGLQQDTYIPYFVSSQDSESKALLDVLFETNPIDKSCGQRLHVKSQPLKIIYDAQTIIKIIDVFKTPQELVDQIHAVAEHKLTDFKEMSATGMQHAINQHTNMDLDINLSAPIIILPYGGLYTGSESVLVVNLGRVSIKSVERNLTSKLSITEMFGKGSSEDEILHTVMSQSYDQFLCELSDVQIILAEKDADWQACLTQNIITPMHLLHPMSLEVQIHKCLVSDDPRLPKIKIDGNLRSIMLDITDEHLLNVLAIFMSIPFPTDEEPTELKKFSTNNLSSSSLSLLFNLDRPEGNKAKISKETTLDSDPLIQSTDVKIRFALKELVVTFSKRLFYPDETVQLNKLLTFNILNLEFGMVQQTYNMSIDVRLGGIGLKHFRTEQTHNVVSTPMIDGNSEYLLCINYLQVNKISPEFHTKYNSCEQSLNLYFTSLTLLLHQEGILKLMSIANDFQNNLEELKQKYEKKNRDRVAFTTEPPKLTTITEEIMLTAKSTNTSIAKQRWKKKIVVETIALNLVAKLNELDINIASDARDITSLAIKGINTNIIVKKSYTQIDAKLEDFIVLDCNPNTKHTKIISITSPEDAVSIRVVMYNIEQTEISKVNMSVTIKMACVRVLFLNSFVVGTLDFLNKFQMAQQALMDAAADAAEAAKQNVQNIYQNATRIMLDINMTAPVIVIPANTQSYHAMVLDLGHLTITNRFINLEVENERDQSVIIDDLKLKLTNLKLLRVNLTENYLFKNEGVLLKPISFALWIKRNLSASWYNLIADIDIIGEMKTIELNINQVDYIMMMQVLNENLAEGNLKTNQPVETSSYALTTIPDTISHVKKLESQEDLNAKVHTFLKYSFTMESLVINLFTGESNELKDSMQHLSVNGLARFSLHILSLKGRIHSDNSNVTSLLLVDCLLDDTRSQRQGKLTRMMERKEDVYDNGDTNKSSTSPDTLRSMFDVTLQQKNTETFIDVRIYSFNLIISMDYLMKIATFFTINPNDQNTKPVPVKAKPISSKTTLLDKAEPVKESTITLNIRIEKPDIILVECMDNIDVKALIMNAEMTISLKLSGKHQTIRGIMNDLQLYTCTYNPAKRKDTKSSVLHPCNITVMGSTPQNKGLHLNVMITAIKLSVSPTTIDLLNRISVALSTTDNKIQDQIIETENYTDIWDPKPFNDSDFWYLKTEMGEDVIHTMTRNYPDVDEVKLTDKELCIISVPSFIITMEAGIGKETLPMLLLESCFEARIQNWSSEMYIDSSLTLQMGYYNSELAIWEPLIEPVETVGPDNDIITSPWELKFELQMNNQDLEASDNSQSLDDTEEIKMIPPKININITSKVNLELVLTKTCIDVMSNLGKAFQSAVKEGVVVKSDVISPYKVINDTGLQLTLMLEESDFDYFNNYETPLDYKEVILESGAEVPLYLSSVGIIDLSGQLSGGLSSTYLLNTMKDKKLVIHVNDMNCNLKIPVVRADKRYFSLNHRGESNDVWGIVSDITMQGAQTILTLRSMLKVFNHFDQPIDVYYMTNRGNELEFIKKVQPGTSTNLPLHAIYTLTNELFFSVESHSVTAVPYIWKDLQLNLSLVKILQCPSSSTHSSEQFIMKVCGEIEQIYHEVTNRHTMTSSCYNIHLRPTITFRNYLPLPVTCIVQGDVKETIVNAGDSMQMPTVNPGHSYVVFKLINYLEKDWTCRYETKLDVEEFSVLQFDSHDSLAKMTLDLGMHCLNKNGTMLFSVYCPFWMLNKTGLMLSYRNSDDNLNVMHHPENFKGPILFSFAAKNFFGKKKASIRVGNGEWSDKFSIDVAGSSGMVVCRSNDKIFQIGVHNQLTYNSLTKQIMFTPYFVLINSAPYAIECQELDRPADPWIKVEPNSCTSLWPRSERDDKLMKIRVADAAQQIAPPFFITEIHNTLLKLSNKYGGINVDVQITEGAVYITFTPYKPGLAPALIVNHTNQSLSFWEKESVVIKKVNAHNNVLFTWDNPTGPRLLIWESGKKNEIEDDLRKDCLSEFLINDERIYWVSFLDGMQRVMLFTSDASIAQDAQSSGDLEHIDQEINVSIHGLGLSVINNILKQEILYLGIASTGIIWEACKTNSKRYKPLSINDCNAIEACYQQYVLTEPTSAITYIVDQKTEVDFKNGMMLRPHKRKIRRSFQTGLWVQMKTSPSQLQLHAKINRVQIDNQMYDCIFPVVLAPVPPPKSVAADAAHKPFAELSIVQRIMKFSRVQQFKYFKILIQEFHIKVDLGFVNAVLSVLAPEERSIKEDEQLFLKDTSLVDEPLLSHVSTQSLQEQKNFYDLLHFSPLKIHISFSLASHSGVPAAESSTPEFINVLLQGIGVTLTDMNDVVFRLAFFEREYTFLTQRQLTSEATSHYIDQAVKQLYVLVLGLDVIGNPYGLVLGLTKGVEDLFYEPFQGAIQGPGEFAEGLVLGVRSLFGHTVGGAAGAVSRITGAMGKGVAVLTFDKDYQRKRRDQFNKKPANLQEGLARSGKGLVMGVFDGVTGVFTKPISGAKEQGVEGFFKGLGKGAVGLVTRPTAGVIDFASGSLEAVKRAAEIGDEVHRLRSPRFMHVDGLVRNYNKTEAEGNKLLMELEKGKYATTDAYVFHKWIITGKDILLLTDKRLAYVVHNDIFGGWQIEWSYTWSEIQVPAKVVDRGVLITTGEPKKKVLGLFGSGENGKVIIIGDPIVREQVKSRIEAIRQR